MNRKDIGFRIEAGPNISQNPELGVNAGEADNRPPSRRSRLTKAQIHAGIILSGITGASEQRIQKALDDEDLQRVVRTEMDEGTGQITEVYGDGRRVDVEPYRPDVTQDFTSTTVVPIELKPHD